MGAFDDIKKQMEQAGERARALAEDLPLEEVKENARKAKEVAYRAGTTLAKEIGKADGAPAGEGSPDSKDLTQAPTKGEKGENRDNSASATKPRGSDGPVKRMPRKPANRRILAIAALIVASAAMIVLAMSMSGGGESEVPEEVSYRLEIVGKENLIFSRYDLAVYLDGEELGELKHGGYFSKNITLLSGTHAVALAKVDDIDVKGELSIDVASDDQPPLYEASCYSDRVEIVVLSGTEANERRAERFGAIANQPGAKAVDVVRQLEDSGYKEDGFSLVCTDGGNEVSEDGLGEYTVASGEASSDEMTVTLHLESEAVSRAEEFERIANQPGVSADTVIAQLERAGYRDAGYDLVCLEGDEKLGDFEAADYEVVEGTVDAQAKLITLRLECTKPIEPSFDSETARRVVVVAMTNCFATDVMNQDGSDRDASKFHSYSDMSGYYMTVEQDGSWTGKSENTWSVSDLVLKAAGSSLYVVASGDITFDGVNYVIPSVEVKYGNSLEDAMNGGGWSGATETYTANEATPYLTVSPDMVAENRDKGAEESARREEADKENAEREYDSWVDSHFSFWNGQCDELVDLVKDRLNDEKSFDHDETSYIAVRDEATLQEVNQILGGNASSANIGIGDVVVVMEFTAKNGFNATIKNNALGVIRYPSGSVELLAIV